MNAIRHISLQDIAARARVGRATVSLALRNHPSLPLATRQRLQKLAAVMNYRPNPLVTALMTQIRARKPLKQCETLAFITSFPTRDGWRQNQPVFLGYYAGARDRASQMAHRLEEIWGREPGVNGSRLTGILRTRGIRGLLIAPLPDPCHRFDLDWSQFAAVTFGPSLHEPDLPRATSDNFGNFLLLVENLARRGYRRIGLVLRATADERVRHAYSAIMLYYQSTLVPANRVPALIGEGLTESHVWRWFKKHRPDVVVGSPGVMNWLRAWGRKIPRDVGYVDPAWPVGWPWAGINQQADLIGAAAVDLVVSQLVHNETGVPVHPKIVLIKGAWVDGSTLRPATR